MFKPQISCSSVGVSSISTHRRLLLWVCVRLWVSVFPKDNTFNLYHATVSELEFNTRKTLCIDSFLTIGLLNINTVNFITPPTHK